MTDLSLSTICFLIIYLFLYNNESEDRDTWRAIEEAYVRQWTVTGG